MATAMDIVHCFKPLDHLDQAIYRDVLRAKQKAEEEFAFVKVATSSKEATLIYDVLRLPENEVQSEVASLGTLTVAGSLLARALVTRKPQHLTVALWAGAVALMGGEETLRRAKSGIQRMVRMGKLGQVSFRLTMDEAVLTYEGQEVHISLAPMRQLCIRALRRTVDGQPVTVNYAIHVDFQDARVLSLYRSANAVEARRLGHQLASALQLPMAFQNVEVSEVRNGYSWEMGPQLGEPALN